MEITASEYGRANAPSNITDREGWGRKTMKKLVEAGKYIRTETGFKLAVSQTHIMIDALALKATGRDYKADHALRGTPPRRHHQRMNTRALNHRS